MMTRINFLHETYSTDHNMMTRINFLHETYSTMSVEEALQNALESSEVVAEISLQRQSQHHPWYLVLYNTGVLCSG
jgi:hypothetical protein